jgi:hypothetical protein
MELANSSSGHFVLGIDMRITPIVLLQLEVLFARVIWLQNNDLEKEHSRHPILVSE